MKYITTIVTIGVGFLVFAESEGLAFSPSDFETIGRRYGVSPHLLWAISILESQGGEVLGEYEVRQVVDTIQLHFLKKIARQTGRSLSDFKGSARGAMGYMQIIPETWWRFKQDGNDDGVKDPLNAYDSVATAAYYLAREIAKKDAVTAAILSYNNSSVYCENVLTLYHESLARNLLAEN